MRRARRATLGNRDVRENRTLDHDALVRGERRWESTGASLSRDRQGHRGERLLHARPATPEIGLRIETDELRVDPVSPRHWSRGDRDDGAANLRNAKRLEQSASRI